MVAHNCHGKTKNLTAKTKTSRQNQKPHGKNKIPHGKTKNLTAKPNTSQQKQNSFGFAVSICFCREVFQGIGFLISSIWFCREVFGFAVRFLFLPWGFWFCRDVFVFAVRFWFCRDSCGPPHWNSLKSCHPLLPFQSVNLTVIVLKCKSKVFNT